MSRFLFVVPPLAGHVNPTISVGRDLARRGHDVAWAGPPGETRDLLPADVTFLPTGRGDIADAAGRLRERFRGLRHAAAFKFLWEDVLIPLGHAMAADVESAVSAWAPDVLVVDQQALAGAAVARRRGLRWATTATTTAELVEPLADLPRVKEWVDDLLIDFQRDLGIPDDRAALGDLRFSEQLVLVFSTRDLVGRDRPFPSTHRFVGPSISDRPESHPFPWDWLNPHLPLVIVSLGTLNLRAGERFFEAAAEALAGEQLQAVLVAPPALLGKHGTADNLLARERVPFLKLLASTDAVVCHGGHNTVAETLAHGLPLVLAPVVDDQPIIANQVVEAGAGLRVRFTRVRPSGLRIAVRSVLDQPSFRRSARAIRASFRAAGGAVAAAGLLEDFAAADDAVSAETTEPTEPTGGKQ